MTVVSGAAVAWPLAAGAQPNFFGVPGAREHSFPLYSVVDAERLRRHLQQQLREHSSTEDATGAEPLTVIVVGGGPTGVETAGALGELSLILWLIVFGVNSQRWKEQASAMGMST